MIRGDSTRRVNALGVFCTFL